MLLTVRGSQFNPTKLNNIKLIGLDQSLEAKINQKAYDSRFKYDLWVESSPNFKDFIISLKNRGYKNLPHYSSCEFDAVGVNVMKKSNKLFYPDVKLDAKSARSQSMLQRKFK